MVSISAPLALPNMSVAQYLWELETASSEVIVEDEDRLAPSLADQVSISDKSVFTGVTSAELIPSLASPRTVSLLVALALPYLKVKTAVPALRLDT